MLNSGLHMYFEMLPIDVKNSILESGENINTLEELLSCVDRILSAEDTQS